MSRKVYQIPSVKVIKITYHQTLLAGSVISIDGNGGIGFGGGGSGDARSRQLDDWDDLLWQNQ